MFEWLTATKTPHEKLIEAIKAGDTAEAQKLIAKMDMTELSKVDNGGETALTYAAEKGLDKVCELLINKMSPQAINAITKIYGKTALIWAADKGLDKVCELLIPKMSPQAINSVANNGWTALTLAAEKGLDKVCELLIPKMSQQAINHVTKDGNTALIFAAEKGLDKVCELLINKMSQLAINQINNNGQTALIFAAYKGLDKVCELLIPKMSQLAINHVTTNGNTALTLAAYKGLDKVCELLISKMSQQAINHVDNVGNTALTSAAWNRHDKICELLISKMSQLAINHVTKNGNTALTWAAEKGLDKVCELLIPKMSEQTINQINNNGETALILATKNGFKNICDLLQKTDNYEKLIEAIKTKNTTEAQKLIAKMDITDLSKVDNGGETALTLAAYKGLDKVCELLIPKMSNQAINHVTKNGETALTFAAGKGLDKVCEMLIPKMSQQAINSVANNGWTALTLAAEKGLDKVCEMLIPKMSEQTINQINNNGETALTWATYKGLDKVCELLINKMSQLAINQINNNGQTALIFAAYKGLDKVCELLINKMSNEAINQINNNGNTALILATKNGFKNICDLLQKTDNYEKLIEAIKTKNTTEAQKLIAKMDITDLSKVDNGGETALTLAAEKGLDKVCEMLIPKMSPQAINQINNNANTALTLAAWKGLDKVCEMLINKMSQLAINHVNKNGETALTWATYKGLDKVCELLIPKMSQQAINQINNNGWTALSLATKNGFKNICDLLQKTDNYEKLIEAIKTKNTTEAQKLIAKMDITDLSKVDNGGETALTYAAYKGLDKVCELLIPKMSNEAINQINNYGNTALILATKNGFKNICDLLTNKEEQQQAYNQQLILAIEENKIEEAKYLNNVDNNNNTALHYTVDKSLTELSMVLIQKMSKEAISIRNIYNNTALHYATDNGLEEVSWLLINKMKQEALDMVNIYGNTALDYAIYNKLIITGFLAKKMSLEVVKTVNANCTGDLANIEYKNIEQYNKTREHEKIIGQCFPLPIKEPSPLSLEEENTSNSEVGLALLAPFSIITTLIVGYFSYLFWNYLRKNSNQKAETLNTQGNIFCGKEEYNKAIEKYKEAIAISKNPLYVTNKTNAEKKYEEQQQSLKLKQTTSIINENKPADIKDLPKEVTKQDLAQENLREKLATFQKIVVETITKLESNTTINEKDKAVLQDSINEIAKTVKTFLNKADIDIITKSMEELANGKITKARIAVVEEDLIEIIEQRVKLEEGMRTEKLVIFEKVIAEMTTKLKDNTTISEKDKDIMQDSINRIVSKVQSLANKTDIETITEIIKELVNGKITKARLGVVEEDIDQLIEQQSKPSHDVLRWYPLSRQIF